MVQKALATINMSPTQEVTFHQDDDLYASDNSIQLSKEIGSHSTDMTTNEEQLTGDEEKVEMVKGLGNVNVDAEKVVSKKQGPYKKKGTVQPILRERYVDSHTFEILSFILKVGKCQPSCKSL